MTEKDFTQKTLEACNDVFADIVNVLLFHGEYIVKEKELETETAQAVYKLNQKLHEEERDVAKYWRNSRVRIAFYGIENQISKDSDMPLRVIGYDGAAYRGQLLKEPEDEQHPYHKQHLYREEKHRYPVITLVLYFGNRRWKRPLSLKDRVPVPERLEPYFSDYRINLFEIAWLTDEQVAMFRSDFRYVADFFVQRRKNKGYIPPEGTIVHVDETLKMMAALTGDGKFEEMANRHLEKKWEVNTMEQVWDEFLHQGEIRGMKIGEERGMKIGEERGIQIGEERGIRIGETRGIQIGETRGIRIGETQGGIRTLVQDNLESGFDKGTILAKLQRRFFLSPEEAERQYLNYAR